MTPMSRERRIVFCALSGMLGLAAMGAATAGPDSWSKVPTLPTGCYASDGWFDRVQAAIDSLSGDIAHQQQLNDAVAEAYKKLGPAEMQSRMMTFMMAHPQDATQFMQKVQSAGQAPAAQYQKAEESKQSLLAEHDAMKTRFNVSVDQATHAARAQIAALGDGEGARPIGPSDIAAVDKANAEYRRLCGEYWGANGPYQAWLKKYKDYLLKDRIPAEEGFDNQQRDVYGVFGIPVDNFQSTAVMKAVREYMQETQKGFSERWLKSWDPTHP